jgi:hypothetical protein
VGWCTHRWRLSDVVEYDFHCVWDEPWRVTDDEGHNHEDGSTGELGVALPGVEEFNKLYKSFTCDNVIGSADAVSNLPRQMAIYATRADLYLTSEL